MSLEKKILKFLQGPKKGETYELKNGLVSQYRNERKDAIQRVIQAMTVGKDVSSLFPDVLKNIATYDLEQKKLVYLYLMNYAKTNPELCILAVNTFVQDTEDPNPLIRALAIRTMGCIRVDKIVDYIEVPLRRTIKDENPYVRKTAAICIAKLYDLNPEVCNELGFLEELVGLIKDPNPMVIANALNSISEIEYMIGNEKKIFVLDYEIVKNFLICLNECTEWGRITILSNLTEYSSANVEEATHIIDRVTPQLQHANSSVVLSSIKVILKHVDNINVTAQRNIILKKLSAPMVSLVSASIPEAQYVGLKNIRIILEKYPGLLSKELRVFFAKYSDPLYLKLEKLEILVRLASESNGALLLGELKEYAMEFETSLVTKSIQSISAVAIKVPGFVVKAVNLLCELIDERGGELVINESVIALTNILRRYPNKNDLTTLIVPIISNHVSDIIRSDGLSCYAWLLGEYPKYFSNLHKDAENLVAEFLESDPNLQLSILNAIVKISLVMNKQQYSEMLQRILDMATKECENSDVRDKAYIYWRILSTSSIEAQKKIVLPKIPPIDTIVSNFNPVVLEALLDELSTLSSVYYKPAHTFIDKNASTSKNIKASVGKAKNIHDLTDMAKREIINNSKNENLLNLDDDSQDALSVSKGEYSVSNSALSELNDIFSTPTVPQGPNSTNGSNMTTGGSTQDILSLFTSSPTNPGSQNITQGIEELSFGNTPKNSTKNQNELLDLF